ncbi:MAG: TldD/PmbA family protein [Thermoplasmata archaeon]|nr:TldD/PmbA family protein [Thermoplasmata archaeon]
MVDIVEIAEKILKMVECDQADVRVMGDRSHLTRFANSQIHQNMYEENYTADVRVVLGKKIGTAKANSLDDASLRKMVDRAVKIAKLQKDRNDFVSLPGKTGKLKKPKTFVRDTASHTVVEKARAVKKIFEVAENYSPVPLAYGALSTSVQELCVANTLGVSVYGKHTGAKVGICMIADEGDEKGYGWSEMIHMDVNRIDVEAVARTAAEKAVGSLHTKKIEPGEYEVILEPLAVAELLGYLAYAGMGALAVQEMRSFLCGNLGKKIMDEKVSIWDDGNDPSGIPMPFDFEGVPRQRVDIIENGVAKGYVYDSYTAGREAKQSTGHALPPGSGAFEVGPLPLNLFMKEGTMKVEDMIANCRRGLLVTKFHYVNIIHPVKTIFTGMTRDGTFYIENGKILHPVKNLRFTQNVVEAFSAVKGLSRERKIIGGDFGVSVCPHVHLEKFHFTGVTEF